MSDILTFLAWLVALFSSWMIFKKMGRQGWEGIIPFYSDYVLCEELYGNGWKFLCILIPLYNIYFIIKLYIDWTDTFHKSTGFAIGMLFLPFIFKLILALDNTAQYGDGSSANTAPDFITKVVDKAREATLSTHTHENKQDDVLEKIEKLAVLKEKGIISEEEYNEKKAELLTKI